MEGAGGGGKRAGAEGGEKKGTPRGAGRGRGRGGRGGRVGGGSNRNANKTAGLLAQLTIDVLGDGSAAIKIRALDVVPKKGEGERKGKDSPDKEEKAKNSQGKLVEQYKSLQKEALQAFQNSKAPMQKLMDIMTKFFNNAWNRVDIKGQEIMALGDLEDDATNESAVKICADCQEIITDVREVLGKALLRADDMGL